MSEAQQIIKLAATNDVAQQIMQISNAEDFGLVGDWTPSTDYVIGDKVVDATATAPFTMYRAKTAHTSGATFTPDLANWEIVGGTGSATDAIILQGAWNANTNSPSLSSGVGTSGDYFRVSVAGTTTLDGISVWDVGDAAIFDGTVWFKEDNKDLITWRPLVKTSDFDVEAVDSGTTFVVDSASKVIATLPESIAANVGTIVQFARGDSGDIEIAVDTGTDVINANIAGEGIENIGGSFGDTVKLQLIAVGQWITEDEKGTWVQTSAGVSITKGYYCGGFTTTFTNKVERWSTLATGSATVVSLTLNSTTINSSGHQSSVDGFYATGTAGATIQDGIDRFDFSTETIATTPWGLTLTGILTTNTQRKKFHQGVSSSSDGFIVGGEDKAGTTITKNITKFNFGTGAAASDIGNLTLLGVRFGSGHQSLSIGEGYIAGGDDAAVKRAEIHKFDFITGSSTTLGSGLGTTVNIQAGASSPIEGYLMGGSQTVVTAAITTFVFATGAVNNSFGALTTPTRLGGGVSSDTDAHFAGGLLSGPTVVDVIEFFDYGTGAQTSQGTLNNPTEEGAGISGT